MDIPKPNTPAYQIWVTYIKEQSAISQNMSVEELVNWLESLGDGSHIHDVNKAKMYLLHFENNSAERFKFGPKYDRLKDLKLAVLLALKNDEWNELNLHMKGWW